MYEYDVNDVDEYAFFDDTSKNRTDTEQQKLQTAIEEKLFEDGVTGHAALNEDLNIIGANDNETLSISEISVREETPNTGTLLITVRVNGISYGTLHSREDNKRVLHTSDKYSHFKVQLKKA